MRADRSAVRLDQTGTFSGDVPILGAFFGCVYAMYMTWASVGLAVLALLGLTVALLNLLTWYRNRGRLFGGELDIFGCNPSTGEFWDWKRRRCVNHQNYRDPGNRP